MTAKPPIAAKLLGWYDQHARALPWRVPPGSAERPDPYRVWLSEVMLQQTSVATVRPRFERFVARWPTVAALAAAPEADVLSEWAGLGYYARARNLIACARRVAGELGGRFPDSEAGLRALPGVGGYTAAAIAAIAFERRAVVVDANVARVVARLFALTERPPGGLPALTAATDAITPDARAGDFAQAMMDLGSAICLPRKPLCLLCPLRDECRAFASGQPEAFPAPKAKTTRPDRFGTIFWWERDGQVLLVRRPAKGLLGGMRALPTGPWVGEPRGLAEPAALADAPGGGAWRLLPATVEHVFTHFRLTLTLAVARGPTHEPDTGEWWPIERLEEAGLPTVFAKAAAKIRSLT